MWQFIISLFTGQIPAIVREIAQARVDMSKTKTESERIAAEERVKALEARRDVLIAESTSSWNTIGRVFLMGPFGLYIWKLIVWDKILAYGQTDDLSSTLWALMFTVFGFYFVTDVTRMITRR